MSAAGRSASRLGARASSSLRAAGHRAQAATWQASAAASSSGRSHVHPGGSHNRDMSFVSEFIKRVRGGVESNPELKKSVEELREQTERLKRETSELAKKAAQATDDVSQRARQAATQVAERFGEAKSQVSSTMRGTLSEAEKTETFSRLKETVSAFKPGKASEQDTSSKPEAHAHAESSQQKAEETEGSSAGTQGDASTSGSAQEAAQQSTWQRMRAQPVKQTLADLFQVVRTEVDLLMKPTPPRSSGTYAGPAGASSALVPVRRKESAWQKRWGSFRDQAATNPLFQRLFTINSKVLDRGKEFADDLRDRWETSDSPIVHSIQDMQDKLFGETDTAIAMKEIRRREPEFSLPEFVYQLKTEIAPLLRSYLEGDLDTIKKWCTSEMVSRISSEVMLWKQEGAVPDSNILNVGDVELAAIKLQGGDPHIVVQFACQQINCVRDVHGNITEGAEDDIQSVYYAWALRQDLEEVEEKLSDTGETYTVVKPKWKLRDMAVRAMRATI